MAILSKFAKIHYMTPVTRNTPPTSPIWVFTFSIRSSSDELTSPQPPTRYQKGPYSLREASAGAFLAALPLALTSPVELSDFKPGSAIDIQITRRCACGLLVFEHNDDFD